MIKIPKRIEIVRTSTPRLSSLSQISAESLKAVLSRHYANVVVTMVDTFADIEALVGRAPDLVFLGMNFVAVNPGLGFDDPDGLWITSYLDEHDIAYTGSSQVAQERAVNKVLAKRRVIEAGLKTAPFMLVRQGQPIYEKQLPLTFPVFIKPTDRGGGLGIDSDSVAHNFEQLQSKVQTIASALGSDSLIEEYLPGREFSVAILKNSTSDDLHRFAIELVPPADKFGVRMLSGRVKSSDSEQASLILDEIIHDRVTEFATDVFMALGARDYGRIDIRLDAGGVPQFLEANLIPSLIAGYGSFPKACLMNADMNYEAMVLNIAQLALNRDLAMTDYVSQPGILEKSSSLTLPV